jgi:beta-N-acetylhexosaminidase
MTRSSFTLIALLAVLAGLLGYNYFAKPFAQTVAEWNVTPSPSPSLIPQSSTDFDSLTPEQRIALVIAAPLNIGNETYDRDQAEWIQTNQPGVVTLFGEKISQAAAKKTIADLVAYDTMPPLLAVDHEGGSVQRLNGEGFTTLPSWQKLCQEPTADRQAKLLDSANELQDLGIDIVFGPVLDLSASGSALGTRTCGSSAQLVAERAKEYVNIFNTKNIISVAKHFPGIGGATKDLHDYPVTITPNEEELRVYQYLLDQYADIGVMMSHAAFKGGLNGEVCSLSRECVSGFKRLFPETLVFSDALDMKSAAVDPTASDSATTRSLSDRAVRAIVAGNNVLVFGPDVDSEELNQVFSALLEQYANDSDVKDEIDTSAKKIFTMQYSHDN